MPVQWAVCISWPTATVAISVFLLVVKSTLAYIYSGMRGAARRALATIQHCVLAGQYRVLPHFLERLDRRGLFWPDVQAVLDTPRGIRYGGRDEWDRQKWFVSGSATDRLDAEIVCVMDVDESGELVLFITIYGKEP